MTQLSTSSCSTTNGASGAATLAQQLVAAKASSDRSSPWLPNNGGGGCGSGRTSPVISDHLKAVLMALPLEEPRVVACTVCPRRFKNQSALNGHMRLHGGYGLNNVGSTSSSSSVSSGKRSQPSQQPPSPPLGPLPSSSSRAAATKPKKHLSSTHDRPMGDIILRDLSEGNQLPRPEDPSVFDWSATPTTATTTMTTPASEADTSQSQRRTPSPQPHCSSTKANLHSLRNLGLTSPGVEAPSPMNTSLVNSQWSARHAPGLLQQQQQSSFNPALTKERFPGVPMFPSTQSPFSLPEVTSITESSSGSYPPTAPSRLSSSLPRLHSDLQCVGDCSATCRQEENASHFAPNPPPPLPAYPALRKRAPFGQQQQQQQFRAAPGLAWFQPQHPQIGDRVESDLLFSSVASNLRLMETQPIGTTAFRDQGKWVPPPPPSVEPFMSSSPSITPAAQFSPHRQRSHQHSQVYQVHGRTPLYPSADQQDVKQETPTAFPSPVAPHFAQQTPVYDQQRHPVGSGPRSVCCGNISADGSVMRHPMTPQHHAYAGHPRAYSYTSTTTHAAYSVPIMSSQERVFFPDDLDPLLALESDEDYGRPTTPKVDTVPPLHQQQQQRHQQQPYEQIQLSSVPSHKYQSTAQLAQPVSVLLSDEPSVFRNPQAPPPSVKKQKRKPAPIIIPSSAHRLNASRLRSPRLWTVSSVGGPTANASVKNDLLSGLLEPPPYTPPPMLSPNRRGSGLFSSIARNRRTLAICSAAAAVGTFRPRNTPVPIRRASPAPPKSAPAFVKNASYFSQDINPKTLINDQAGGGIDGNSDRLNGLGAATRAIMRTVEDIGGKDQAKPKSLFFGEDEDDLDGLVVVSRRRDTPDTEEAKSNSPGGASTGTSRSFSSCCCSPVRHTVDVDVEEEDEDDIVEDIGVPSNFEPKINIGPAYQVEVPEFVEGQHSTFLFGPLSMLVSECLYFIF
uniref:C2H2-type domain-containing protein n=1 Tax=Mesocestoides corti TaxID=53468 RepID=A0A5K3EY32_MESCO